MKLPIKIEKRKLLLINPNFQLTFMAYMMALALIVVAVFYGANVYFFSKFIDLGHSIKLPPDHIFFQFINRQKYAMGMIFLMTASIAAMAIAVAGLFLSHRVAGPLVRLRNAMEAAADGKECQPVHFREHDFFPELAKAFNSLCSRFGPPKK